MTARTTEQLVVLLVQPNDDSLDMYVEFLRANHVMAIAVSTAADALTQAHQADVVVTGVLLPGGLDGVGLVERLRRDTRTKQTPIIVLTACAWRTERERAEAAGCDAFLPKPCLPDELLREIRRVVKAAKLRDMAGAPLKASDPSVAAARPRKRRA